MLHRQEKTGKNVAPFPQTPPVFPRKPAIAIVLLLLGALLLTGVGRIATMPPFSGLDETAHYSRIEAAAFSPPDKRSDFIAADVFDYTHDGPMPYFWIVAKAFNASFNDALDSKGKVNIPEKMRVQGFKDYHAYFEDAPGSTPKLARLLHGIPGKAVFRASIDENWEYQHPALYYILQGSLLRHIADAPLADRLLVLRLANYLMAFAGFVIGLLATWRHLALRRPDGSLDVTVFAAFTPFLLPAFFGEFDRIGNDNLCLLLFSILWALLLLHLRQPSEKSIWAAIGIVSGYAWLTKATMIAVSAGIFIFMVARKSFAEEDMIGEREGPAARLLPAITAFGLSAVISAAAYISRTKGHMNGSEEFDAWTHGRGFLHPGAGFPWLKIFQNILHMLNSFVYPVSDIIPSISIEPVNVILPALAAVVFGGWLFSLPRDPRREEWLPLYVLLPLAGGILLWGVLSSIAYRITGTMPGQYLHTLMPALALIAGAGLRRCACRRSTCFLAGAALLLSLFGDAVIEILRLALYSGCAWQSAFAPYFGFDDGGACRPEAFWEHLSVLSWPAAGISCLVLAFLLQGGAVLTALIYLRRRSSSANRAPGVLKEAP